MNNCLIINIFGGPCLGKSTIAAALFAKMKIAGISVELVTEYAKGMTWQSSQKVLENQIYVFGKQHHYLTRPNQQVKVIITDSPILMSVTYDAKKRATFKSLVIEEFKSMNNMNFLLNRIHKYDNIGRNQDESMAIIKDKEILDLLIEAEIPYIKIDPLEENLQLMVEMVQNRLKEEEILLEEDLIKTYHYDMTKYDVASKELILKEFEDKIKNVGILYGVNYHKLDSLDIYVNNVTHIIEKITNVEGGLLIKIKLLDAPEGKKFKGFLNNTLLKIRAKGSNDSGILKIHNFYTFDIASNIEF